MTNLEKWRFIHKDIESPNSFIDWSFYFLISACLQRRVWISTAKDEAVREAGSIGYEIYPNIFVTLVGDPATGKGMAIMNTRKILESFEVMRSDGKIVSTKDHRYGEDTNTTGLKSDLLFPLCPDNLTCADFYKRVADCSKVSYQPITHRPYIHCSLAIISEDLQTMFNKDTIDYIKALTQLYDSRNFVKSTKTQGENIIKNVCLAFIAGTTPSFIEAHLDPKIIGDGFASRVIYVYAPGPRFRKARIETTNEQIQAVREIREWCKKLGTLQGSVTITKEADDWFIHWYENDYKDECARAVPSLRFYYGRKGKLHIQKMALVLHFMEKDTMTLDLEDYLAARDALAAIEPNMHIALDSLSNNPVLQIQNAIIMELKAKSGRCGKIELLRIMNTKADMRTLTEAITALETIQVIKRENQEYILL